MENIKYFIGLLIGENWPVLALIMIIMLIMAYTNCVGSKATGQVMYRRKDSFFRSIAVAAGCFHIADLFVSYEVEDLTLVEITAVKNPANAVLLSMLIIALLGVAIATFYYAIAEAVLYNRSKFIERRMLHKYLRRKSRIQQDRYKY